MQSTVGILVLGLCAVVQGITTDEFYPFHPRRDARLAQGNVVSSSKISLAVPAKFYNTEYDYLWVHTDGFISFAPDMENLPESEFPFAEALLAPFMADLDTTRHGTVYYRESHSQDVLTRASSAIQRSFPTGAADFEAESAFIVTWHEVEGQSVTGETALFTFQSILVSNGQDTYAIFLYPRLNFGVSQDGTKLQSSVFDAKVGFNQGNDRYLEMYPTNSMVDYKNTKAKGEWIFQIGGEGVVRNNDVVLPEKARHGKRQIDQIFNVQEVNLEEEEDLPDYAYNDPVQYDYCSSTDQREQCTSSNSHCANYPSSYCCECDSGYVGNGNACIGDGSPVTINGNITGVVDTRNEDGQVERFHLTQSAYHSYAITEQGRFHTAISDVPAALGRAMQPIVTFGTVVGWLFAVPTAPAVNGLQYTGGDFSRRVSIRFQGNSEYKFDMRQQFFGVSNQDNVDTVTAKTSFVGLLPAINENEKVNMPEYEEQYVKEGTGRITSTSVRTYTVADKVYSYTISQTIYFPECKESLQYVPDVLNLQVSGIFLKYHDDNNVRYAMYGKVNAGGAQPVVPTTTPYWTQAPRQPTNPPQEECNKDRRDFQCHMRTTCDQPDVKQYLCECGSDFGADTFKCDDIPDCVGMPCQNTYCETFRDSYTCACYNFAGFNRGSDGNQCIASNRSVEDDGRVEERDPCSEQGICGRGVCTKIEQSYSCYCENGYYFDDYTCVDIDECYENRHNCAINAGCSNAEGTYYCTCNPGFSGDGITCLEDAGRKPTRPLSQCEMEEREVDEMIRTNPGLQDGPEGPDCMEDGTFAPRQCNGFTQVCWCVETTMGTVMEGSMTRLGQGYLLDCSAPPATAAPTAPPTDPPTAPPTAPPTTPPTTPPTAPAHYTQCQTEKWEAEQTQPRVSSSERPVFVPLCTGSGAYEPIQYHPAGFFMCVDFNGEEIVRSSTEPDCLTPCQKQEYYAGTDNEFAHTNKFVPQCTETGDFARVQCDERTASCYCVDQNGEEISNSRISTDDPSTATPDALNCDRLDPSFDQPAISAEVIFAQANSIGGVDLPIGADSVAKRLYFHPTQMAIGLAFDCANQNLYWTDGAGRSIFMAPIDDLGAKVTFASGGVKSPEGIAVDYVSGNVYWTDSGLDRIEMANANGANRKVIISKGLSNPRGIAVDPFEGKLYWSDWNRKNPRIMSSNLDGSNPTVFVSSGLKLPNDVTIDYFHRKVCFLDADTKKIECMNMDGSGRTVVYNIPTNVPSQPFGLAVDGDMIYYTDRRGHLLNIVNLATNEKSIMRGPIGSHGQMFGVTIGHSACSQGYNTCSTNNGGCSHICAAFPKQGTRKCLCPDKAATSCVPSE